MFKIETIFGLASSHAYAVLDLVEINTGTNRSPIRLLHVKNPWARKANVFFKTENLDTSWLGRYSKSDKDRWTKRIIDECVGIGNNPYPAQDDGIFWINLESVVSKVNIREGHGVLPIGKTYSSEPIHLFDSIHLNWNPELFKYKYSTHCAWNPEVLTNSAEDVEAGPKKDTYNCGKNPQFGLEINSEASGDIIWILLTKHITKMVTSITCFSCGL